MKKGTGRGGKNSREEGYESPINPWRFSKKAYHELGKRARNVAKEGGRLFQKGKVEAGGKKKSLLSRSTRIVKGKGWKGCGMRGREQ